MKTAVVETTLQSWSLQKYSNITGLYAFKRDVFVKLVLLKNKKDNIHHGKCWELKIACN